MASLPSRGWGKRPLYRGFLQDATTDPELIARTWRREPSPNVGIICGESFVAFDIEVDHLPALSAWMKDGGHDLPQTPVARSGRGGVHVLVEPFVESGHALRLGGVRIGELKGRGGFIVACPSQTSGAYSWLRSPEEVAVGEAPSWLRGLAADRPAKTKTRVVSGSLSPSRAVALAAGLYRVVASASEGERNDILFWASCRAAEHGLEPSAVTDILVVAAHEAGLPEREARRTISSGFQR